MQGSFFKFSTKSATHFEQNMNTWTILSNEHHFRLHVGWGNHWSGFGAKASTKKTKRWSTQDWSARMALSCQNSATPTLICRSSSQHAQYHHCRSSIEAHTTDTSRCYRCCNRASIVHTDDQSRHVQFRAPYSKMKAEPSLATRNLDNMRKRRVQKRTQTHQSSIVYTFWIQVNLHWG